MQLLRTEHAAGGGTPGCFRGEPCGLLLWRACAMLPLALGHGAGAPDAALLCCAVAHAASCALPARGASVEALKPSIMFF